MTLCARLIRFSAAAAVLVAFSATAIRAEKKKQPQQTAEPVDLSKPFTLERAIQIGLAYQSQLGIARSQLDSSRARVVQAQASYFPSIAPTYNYSNQLSTVTV